MRVYLYLFVFLAFSCSDSDTDQSVTCVPVVLEQDKFNSAPNFGTNLNEFSLNGSCLTVKLGISGCDDDHILEMVSDGAIAKTNPPQITFDFYDNNIQDCEAYFIVEREYDLSPINELYDGEEIIVTFRNNDKSFTYVQ